MVRSVSGLMQASARSPRVRGQTTTLLAVITTGRLPDRIGALPAGGNGEPLWRGVAFLRFILWGSGEVAPVTREILRRAEPDRPHVHAG